MARSTQRQIDFIFTGNSKDLNRALAGVDSSISGIAAPAADLAGDLLLLEAAIIAVGTAFAVSAFNQAKNFEEAVSDLQKVLGEGEGIEPFIEQAIKLSEIYGQSAASILQSASDFKQAGFTTAESMQLAKDAMDLVTAGGIEASEASDILVASLKGFQLPATETGRILDILNEVSNKFASNTLELGTAFSKLSPIARQAGLSLEQTAAVSVAVIEVFRDGDDAAVALKTGLQKLVGDSAKVKTALDSLGVSQRNLNGELRPAGDILFDVAEAFTKVEQSNKLYLAGQLSTNEQAGRLLTVFDNLGQVISAVDTGLASAGSSAKEVAVKLETAQKQVDRFAVAFQNVQVAIGNKFLISAKNAIGGATELEIALRKVVESGGFDKLFDALKPQLNQLDELFRQAAKNLPEAFAPGNVDFSPLIESIDILGDAVGEAFTALFGDIDVSTPENLAKAINKVIDSVAALTKFTGFFIKEAVPFISIIGKSVDEFVKLDDSGKLAAAQVALVAKSITEFGTKVTGALTAISATGASVESIFKVLGGAISAVVNVVQVAFDTYFALSLKITEGVAVLLGGIEGLFGGTGFFKLANELNETSNAVTDNLVRNSKELSNALSQIETGLNGVTEKTEKVNQKLKETTATSKVLSDEDFLKAWIASADKFQGSIFSMQKSVKALNKSGKLLDVTDSILEAGKAFDSLSPEQVLAALEDTSQAALKVPESVNKATESIKNVGKSSKEAAKDAQDLVLSVLGLVKGFNQTNIEAAKVQKSFADLDIDAAKLASENTKLADEAAKTGAVFGKIGTRFAEAGQEALSARVTFAGLSKEIVSFGPVAIELANSMKGAKDSALDMALGVVDAGIGIEGSLLAFKKADNAAAGTIKSWAELDLKAKSLEIEAKKAGVAFGGIGIQFQEAGRDALETTVTFDSLLENLNSFGGVVLDVVDKFEGIPSAAIESAIAILDAGRSATEAQIGFRNLENETAKTKLAFAELDVGFQTEQLKADTEQAKAIIGTLEASFQSTGATLSSLFDTLAQGDLGQHSIARAELEESIRDEKAGRNRLQAQQEELLREQILELKRKGERVDDGQITINVDGTGLAPELQTIFFTILDEAQVKMQGSQADFLVGAS